MFVFWEAFLISPSKRFVAMALASKPLPLSSLFSGTCFPPASDVVEGEKRPSSLKRRGLDESCRWRRRICRPRDEPDR